MAEKVPPKKRGRKPKKPFSNKGLANVKRLWKIKTAQEWFELLNEIAPQYRWEMNGQSQIKGCCPYHQENTPSFNLSFTRSFGRCFGCDKNVVDITALIAKLRGCSYTEALLFLHNRFNISEILGNGAEELNKYHQIQEMKKAVAVASGKVLAEYVRDRPAHLNYCKPAIEYLVQGRGLPLESLPGLPVGVFAKPEHIKKYIEDPSLHPVFEDYFKEQNNRTFWGSVMMHYNDSPGTISRFKLRVIDTDAVKKCNASQYDLCTTPKQEAATYITKKFVYPADPYSESLGLYGLHKYQALVGRGDSSCYVTEGEFDALSTMAGQDLSGSQDFIILATGGKGSQDLGFLREYGILTVWLVPDHPVQQGDEWALGVLSIKSNFSSNGSMRPLSIKIFNWPAALPAGDLDSVVQYMGYERVKEYLYMQRNVYFCNAVPWVQQKCDNEIEGIKSEYTTLMNELDASSSGFQTQVQNLQDDQRTAIRNVIIRWFKFINDPSEKSAFLQGYAATENIDVSEVAEVTQAIYSTDSWEGIVSRVMDSLEEYLVGSYYDRKSTGPGGIQVAMWSKRAKTNVTYSMNDKDPFMIVPVHVGQDLEGWVSTLIPDHPVLEHPSPEATMYDRHKHKRTVVKSIFQHGMESHILGKLPAKQDLTVFAQGIHYIDLPKEALQKNRMYFVNGRDVYRGTFTEKDQVDWEEVNNQVDSGILFDNLGNDRKWSHVSTVEDLRAGVGVDLKKLYDDFLTIINGWKFEHHDLVSRYLAAYALSLPILRAVGQVNITFLTGEKESGKTSLLNGLFGGTINHRHDVPSIVESTSISFDTTTAGLYQDMDGSSLTFVLDEAEQSENHNTAHDDKTKEILRMLYSMPQGGIAIKRGGATRDQRTEYYLRLPILLGAINLPTDSTFLSRVFIVSTVKDPGRMALDDYISDRFTDTDIEHMRNQSTIALLHRIPEIIERRAALRTKLAALRGKVANVSNRFLEGLVTPLTVYEMAGYDAEELYTGILTKYRARLEAIHNTDQQLDIINACLYSESIRTSVDDVTSNVSARSLIMNEEYNILNNSDCGVYFVPKYNWILIVWRQAKYTVLKNTPYSRMDESLLKERCAKSDYVEPEISEEDHAVMQRMLRLTDVKTAAGYTVLHASYLMDLEDSGATVQVPESVTDQREEKNTAVTVEEVVTAGEKDLCEDMINEFDI